MPSSFCVWGGGRGGSWDLVCVNVCVGDDGNVTQIVGWSGRRERSENFLFTLPAAPHRNFSRNFPPCSARENVVFMLEPCIYVGFFPLLVLLFGIPFKCFPFSRRKKCSDFIDFPRAMKNIVSGEIVMDFYVRGTFAVMWRLPFFGFSSLSSRFF